MRPLRLIADKLSLSARLATISAAIGFLVVAVAVAVGYFALSQQLDRRALLELNGKQQLVRHLLGEIGSAEKVPDNAYRFGDLLVMHADLHLAIVDDGSGKVIASFSPLAL